MSQILLSTLTTSDKTDFNFRAQNACSCVLRLVLYTSNFCYFYCVQRVIPPFLIDRALYIIHEASFATFFFFGSFLPLTHIYIPNILYIFTYSAMQKYTHTQASVKTFFRILRRESRMTIPDSSMTNKKLLRSFIT